MRHQSRFTNVLRMLLVMACCTAPHLKAQLQPSYTLNFELVPEENKLYIQQQLRIHNQGAEAIDTLYFNDWATAYANTKTPLSQRLAEEFDRSFYLSSSSRLGGTEALQLSQGNTILTRERLKAQPDLFRVVLPIPLQAGATTEITLQYQVKIPSSRFTGYGVSGNRKSYDLRYWYIALSPYADGTWKKYSNLNLDDASLVPSDYQITASFPAEYKLFSNLKTLESQPNQSTSIKAALEGKSVREVRLVLQQQPDYFTLTAPDGFELVTNIKESENTKAQLQDNFERIYSFITSKMGAPKFNKQLLALEEYNKNPFYGLSQLPFFLSPFDASFTHEIKLLKTFAITYLESNLLLDQRRDHWIIEGLHIYLAMKYIETFYPEKKFMGRLSSVGLLNSYAFTKLSFNEGFQLFAEQMLRSNNFQSLNTSKVDLIRFNERIGSPYLAGLSFQYLEDYLGESTLDTVLSLIPQADSAVAVKALFKQATTKDLDGFFTTFLNSNRPLDVKIKRLRSSDSLSRFQIQRQGFEDLPIALSLLKGDTVQRSKWISPKTTTVAFPNSTNADYLVLNHKLGLPELNRKNNRIPLHPKKAKNPLKFTFVKDIEAPKYTQVFYNPLTSFNLYDGLMFGLRLNNKKIGAQNFNFDIRPFYTSNENTMVGSFATTYKHFKYDKKNYLTLMSIFGSSFHYAENKRYYVVAPTVSFLFRPPYLRSNKVEALNFSLFKVEKFGSISSSETPEYSIFKTQYLYSNKGSINYFTLNTGVEFAQHFSKMDATLDYRKLFPSGRQLQIRTFSGLFLSNKTGATSYFDYNLTRPNDYLYQYDLFGRSESTGVFGQQFVIAEGGFKSLIPNSNANQWMVSTNLTYGLWRWLEVYLDGALVKSRNVSLQKFYGTGIRFNLLPDYLEVFFPVASTNGIELTKQYYSSKIRFVLSIRGSQLKALFSRSWF